MVENLHLIQFISQTSSVTPDFLFALKPFFTLSNEYAGFKEIR